MDVSIRGVPPGYPAPQFQSPLSATMGAVTTRAGLGGAGWQAPGWGRHCLIWADVNPGKLLALTSLPSRPFLPSSQLCPPSVVFSPPWAAKLSLFLSYQKPLRKGLERHSPEV